MVFSFHRSSLDVVISALTCHIGIEPKVIFNIGELRTAALKYCGYRSRNSVETQPPMEWAYRKMGSLLPPLADIMPPPPATAARVNRPCVCGSTTLSMKVLRSSTYSEKSVTSTWSNSSTDLPDAPCPL